VLEVGLARPADRPDQLRPLFALKTGGIDAGFGIDRLRLSAPLTEPLHATEHKGGWAVSAEATAPAARIRRWPTSSPGSAPAWGWRRSPAPAPPTATSPRKPPRRSPPPGRSAPSTGRAAPRPAPHAVPPRTHPDRRHPDLPARFTWRGRTLDTRAALGPERIAPEWWLDDPDWRSGVRDYWRVTTGDGTMLWLYYAHGGTTSGGWFAHGDFG
jgi:protein ImuB